jgi:hypothetical protein
MYAGMYYPDGNMQLVRVKAEFLDGVRDDDNTRP